MTKRTLAELIAAEIQQDGAIPFSRFMERALYDPSLGYYAGGGARIGRGGDYFTAAHVGPALGECLARQLGEMDRILGRPDPFTVLEFGAGQGWLARDLLDALASEEPDLCGRTRLVLVDASPAMRQEASRRVPEARVVAPGETGTADAGVVLAVELFDALPVHRVRRLGGKIREIFVGIDGAGKLAEVLGESLPETAAMVQRYGAAEEEGDEAEVCLAALEMVDTIERSLLRGFFILVDYGDSAQKLARRAAGRGTLLAYHRHATNDSYLERVGEQDLTAHVNFTALEDRAREQGLTTLGLTTQDRFLIANGILLTFEERDPSRWGEPQRVRRRLQAMQILHPEGMGRIFKVLILSKRVDPPATLSCLGPFDVSAPPGSPL